MDTFDYDLVSSYCGLLSLATGSIWAGSFASLPKSKNKSKDSKNVEDDDEEDDVMEMLSTEDAWMFPIIGSFVLLGLYLAVKYLGKEWINWLLNWYFSAMGVGSVWKASVATTRFLLGERYQSFHRYHWVLRKGKEGSKPISVDWRTPAILLLPFAIVPSFVLFTYSGKSAIANNIIALSLCHNALSMLRLDSFATGTILLSGLFLYDIWWVFGTNVMVSVATSLDLPIKLLWPKSLLFASDRGFTLLGLGDIVIPGIFVALGLRYDHHQHKITDKEGPFKKHYFYGAMMAYILGLVMTMSVMHVFKAAQPALLYLSPACISSFFLVALAKGQLKDAWSWSDGPSTTKDEIKKEE